MMFVRDLLLIFPIFCLTFLLVRNICLYFVANKNAACSFTCVHFVVLNPPSVYSNDISVMDEAQMKTKKTTKATRVHHSSKQLPTTKTTQAHLSSKQLWTSTGLKSTAYGLWLSIVSYGFFSRLDGELPTPTIITHSIQNSSSTCLHGSPCQDSPQLSTALEPFSCTSTSKKKN